MEIRGRCWCYLVKKLMEHDFLSACVEMVHLAHPGWLVIALMINQFGNAFTGSLNVIGLIAAIAALALIIYMLFKPYKEATKLSDKH